MYRSDKVALGVIAIAITLAVVFFNMDKIIILLTKVDDTNIGIMETEIKKSSFSEKNKAYIFASLWNKNKEYSNNKYVFFMLINGKKRYEELDNFTKMFINAFLMADF